MRIVKYTSRFRRDYRREKSGRQAKRLMPSLSKPSPSWRRTSHCRDGISIIRSAASGSDNRDCHIRPDLILIYRKPDDATLELVRVGSHSELGL